MKRLLNESTTSWCSQFLVSEVVRNITKHKLVPKHTKLSPSEMQKKLKRWNISNTALLPHILTSDPVARYLGLIDGDVVEIKGSFGTSNGTLHFRLATSG
ncbi:MAG: DNA-directed RNA polymerase subunit H [Deltaproteobacteria bacterium]|nr:DNA-directed RNA polymerase subunit H [Deltaproteobacteria bacterium]